jgi:RNA polymerase sigma factor (sigma-70 family)
LVIIEDQGMVREVLAGKREAYRRLVEKYQGRVAAAISRVIGFRPEVEDLVQETFWQAYRSLGRFRGEARFSTWLMRIAVNKAIDFQRRRREERCYLAADHTPLAEISSAQEEPEPLLLAKEQEERLYRYLERLPPLYRQVLRRHYLEGFSYREMAGEAGVPVKTIESRLYRARKLLRSIWRGL